MNFNNDNENSCIICYDTNINLIKPVCGHYICLQCFFKIQDPDPLHPMCPVCRQHYDNQLYHLKNTIDLLLIYFNLANSHA
jgi:hypothetical protein